MLNPDFETEKYRFWFAEKEPSFRYFVVVAEIDRVDRGTVTDKDVDEIKDFFGDLGKWETFIKTGKTLLDDLGIKLETEKRYEKEFGAEKYRMNVSKDDRIITATIELSHEEILRRTKGAEHNGEKLTKEEILNQVKNIPKWKTLMKAISTFKA